MLKWLFKTQSAIFWAFCALLVLLSQPGRAENTVAFEITDFKTELSGDSLSIAVVGTMPPVYTVSERFSPFRIVVDIAGGRFASNLAATTPALPANGFSKLSVSELKDQTPNILRMEYTLADSHDYTVSKNENSLQIKLSPASARSSKAQSGKERTGSLTLKDIRVSRETDSTTLLFIADAPIDSIKVDTLPAGEGKKPRMYIDIDGILNSELPKEKLIGGAIDKVRISSKGKGLRLVFDSATDDLFKYQVTSDPLGFKVVVTESKQSKSPESGKNDSLSAKAKGDDTLDALIGSSQQLVKSAPEKTSSKTVADKASALASDFSLSGYNKQRISVDFYKIDIHNVFRLFRQITNLNIIVDEEVQGSLTLVLNEVPWDFALDIILNLMDLKKEERFNTIVIYPGKKAFVWPNRTEDNLAFEADVQVIEQEALVIEKSAGQSKEIIESKRFLAEAQIFEEKNEFENAAIAYTKALELWPSNAKAAARLASIYLVDLRVNAKAAFYAKQCLKNDPKDSQAALYAAIALANMQQNAEAKEYFSQSISGSPPLKEALFSYAVFSENNGQFDAAMKVLQKFESHYGETVDTMVSKARIFDKQGKAKEATQQYRSLLGSGFPLNPDLKKYIEGRIAAKDLN
jgi:type IV pilus assembly protein PilQ